MNTPHVDVKGIVKVKVKGIVKVDIKRNPLMWSRRQDIKNFLLILYIDAHHSQYHIHAYKVPVWMLRCYNWLHGMIELEWRNSNAILEIIIKS